MSGDGVVFATKRQEVTAFGVLGAFRPTGRREETLVPTNTSLGVCMCVCDLGFLTLGSSSVIILKRSPETKPKGRISLHINLALLLATAFLRACGERPEDESAE